MSDILLTHSNHLYSDRKQIAKMQPYAPLQTLLAAAKLRESGHAVALCDVTLADSPDDAFRTALADHRPQLVAVVEDNFNFLTKMCTTVNRELAFRMATAARDAGVPIVVNGSDSTDRPASYRAAGFDAVLTGDIECALTSYVGQAVSPASEPLHNLDLLPEPAWGLINLDPYRDAWTRAHGRFSVNLVSSRGCPFKCNWCAKPVFGVNYRHHSAERTARELLHAKRELRADHVWFADDIFALSPQWTRRFADEVERIGARLPFKMQSRCDLMTRDTVAALRSAGCAEIWMGAESGSQTILDAMDKGTRVEHIYEARENLRRHGIRAGFFLQFGYPGETWPDIEQTIRMVRETAPDDIGVSVAYPLPGTKFYDRVAAQLGPKVNWSHSGDLDMMFHGAYSSDFYRALADALHEEVRGGSPDWDRVQDLCGVSPCTSS